MADVVFWLVIIVIAVAMLTGSLINLGALVVMLVILLILR